MPAHPIRKPPLIAPRANLMRHVIQDIRYGWRLMGRNPGFTIMAVVTLGLGIGANTAIFSLAEALFYRPMGGEHAAGLVVVARTEDGRVRSLSTFSYDEYRYLDEHVRTLDGLAAHYSTAPLDLTSDDGSREINGAVVSATYFTLLGAHPLLGRFFTPDQDRAGQPAPVVVLSHELWQKRFAGDRRVLGRSIRLNGTAFTVIGVAPAGFHGVLIGGQPNDVWIPLSMLAVGYRWCADAFAPGCTVLQLLGRPGPHISMGNIRAELTVLGRRLDDVGGNHSPELGLTAQPARGVAPGAGREEQARTVTLLLAAASLLLLVACVNLAGALLSKGLARRREIAIRLSIGGTPGRVARQLLVEGMMLALLGGALGALVALWGQRLLTTLYTVDPEGYRRVLELRLDPVVLAFALALTVATGLVFGLAPALRSARVDLATALKIDDRVLETRRLGLRDILMVGQLALSFMALTAGGLLARSMAVVRSGGGFDVAEVALLRLRPRLVGYDSARAQAFHHAVLRRLEALPEVRAASLIGEYGAVWGKGDPTPAWLPGREPARGSAPVHVRYSEIAPHFFQALGVSLLRGRDFAARDDAGAAPVAIVNQTLAQRFWPDGTAVGHSIVVAGREVRVVGVVEDAHFHSAAELSQPFLYTPYWQDPGQVDARLAIRVRGDPALVLPALVRAIHSVDPVVPVTETMPMRTQVEAAFNRVRMAASAMSYAGLLAVILCALGLYGVLAMAVSARQRELAIRMALGAGRGAVLRAVGGRALALVGAGTVVGLPLAFAATRLLAGLAFGISVTSPALFLAAGLLIAGVSVAATWVPTRRALRIQPREALLQE